MCQVGLRNAVFKRAGEMGPGKGPNSARQIDGTYMIGQIQIKKAGYLGYNSSPGDLRIIWIDISWTKLAGEEKEKDMKFMGRQLMLEDPRVWGKYIANIKKKSRKRKCTHRHRN